MLKYQNIKCHYCQMIKCRIIQYKRGTFQLGLQARNINKSEKNHATDRTALFISKPVKCQQQRENKKETIRNKGKEEKR